MIASSAPPLIMSVVPAAPNTLFVAWFAARVPALKVRLFVAPPKVLLPVRMSEPDPFLIKLKAPPFVPVSVSALVLMPSPGPLVVTVRSAVSVTEPGRLKAALPPKLTSAPQVMRPAAVLTTAAPEVLSMVPPLRASVAAAAPRAAALFTFTRPALRTN